MVLVTVFWLMVFLSLLGATLVSSVRIETEAKAQAIAQLKAQEVADGLLRQAAGHAQSLPIFRAASQNGGAEVQCQFAGYNATISVTDLSGLIDLNMASKPTLAFLFRSAGKTSGQASRLADAVLDYRDHDQIKRSEGAELASYKAEGLLFGPKNGPFQTVTELDQVLGLTPDLVEQLTPWLTVHEPRSGLALGASPLALREKIRAAQKFGRSLGAEHIGGRGRQTGKRFDVSVGVNVNNSTLIVQRAIIDLTSRFKNEITFLLWSSERSSNLKQGLRTTRVLSRCESLVVP